MCVMAVSPTMAGLRAAYQRTDATAPARCGSGRAIPALDAAYHAHPPARHHGGGTQGTSRTLTAMMAVKGTPTFTKVPKP
jgi:hypothetical protein